MAAHISGVLSNDLQTKIKQAKVLLVGAGGIGCEILKNLVMTGFTDIDVIDLDTIDVSNLNRQFLFHKIHVGKPKALVAKDTVLTYNSKVNINAYHDNIMSQDYNVNFFKKFTFVMNALDNRRARFHVNRMCLAANIPLIESGSAGYFGQVEVILKGKTMCYECLPKPPQRTYPGCTIRNTPSEPIHCIVWAKHLFNQLFGEDDPDQDVSPDTADPEAAGDAGEAALKAETKRVSTREWAAESNYSDSKLFTKLFHDDIRYLLSMANLWKTRRPPEPLVWGEIPGFSKSDFPNGMEQLLPDQRIWTLSDCARMFTKCLKELCQRLKDLPKDEFLVWDKDDRIAMEFVTVCANLRSHIFGIERKSLFDIKSMAGQIIPAIATTNAIVAGLVVLKSLQLLQENYEQCQSVYVRNICNHRGQQIVGEKFLIPPSKNCRVCSEKATVTVALDLKKTTLKQLEQEVLIKLLAMVAPDVILFPSGAVVLSSEPGDTDDNNDKILEDLGMKDGSLLQTDDFLQNYTIDVTLVHREAQKDEAQYEILTDTSNLKPKPNEDETSSSTEGSKAVEQMDDDDDLMEVPVDYEEPVPSTSAVKRKTDECENDIPIKRPKLDEDDDDDDDDEDIIEL